MESTEDRSARLKNLKLEEEELDSSRFPCTSRVVNEEIKFLETGSTRPPKYLDIITDKPLKLEVKILIPVNEHPKFNFVGKLLGPRGNSMKRMQEMTGTRMSILGKGSLRDKKKEDELRDEGLEKNTHLKDDLHVLIEVFAPAAEAYNRLAYGIAEIRKYLIPDPNDDIRQSQLRELAIISGSYTEVPAAPGRGVGMSSRGGMMPQGPMNRGSGGGGGGGGNSGGGGGGNSGGPPPNMPNRFPSPPQAPPAPNRPFPGPPGGAGGAPGPSMRGGTGPGGRGGFQTGYGRPQQQPQQQQQQQQQQPQSQYNSGRMGPAPGQQGEFNGGYNNQRGGNNGYNNSGGPMGGYQGMGGNDYSHSGYGSGPNNSQNWGDNNPRLKAPSPFTPQKDDTQSEPDKSSSCSSFDEIQWILLYASTKHGFLASVTPRDLSAKEKDLWETFFKSRLP